MLFLTKYYIDKYRAIYCKFQTTFGIYNIFFFPKGDDFLSIDFYEKIDFLFLRFSSLVIQKEDYNLFWLDIPDD
ncbi:hypothetical protein C4S76_00555 [Apibacter adventoris]|nr:hypothetical protein C4S76_00555 [Apibacter adventoris]